MRPKRIMMLGDQPLRTYRPAPMRDYPFGQRRCGYIVVNNNTFINSSNYVQPQTPPPQRPEQVTATDILLPLGVAAVPALVTWFLNGRD